MTVSALSCAQVCKNKVIFKDPMKDVVQQVSNISKNRNKRFFLKSVSTNLFAVGYQQYLVLSVQLNSEMFNGKPYS